MQDPHPIQIKGDDESQNQTDGRADDEIGEGVLENLPELRILEQLDVIGNADELCRAQQVPVGEGQPEGLQRRVKTDDAVKQDRDSKKAPDPHKPFRAHGKAIPEGAAGAAGCRPLLIDRCHDWTCGFTVWPRR
ncbi:hypothetical protein D3C87_1474020 [compost metagenome]